MAPISPRDLVLGALGRVPSTVDRAHIEDVVTRFAASYATADVDTRVGLCSPEVHFEDPVGIVLARGREQLHAMWSGLIRRGMSLALAPERVIVVGDEALALAHMAIRTGETEPADLFLALHFTFGADGLITMIRTFFDPGCVG